MALVDYPDTDSDSSADRQAKEPSKLPLGSPQNFNGRQQLKRKFDKSYPSLESDVTDVEPKKKSLPPIPSTFHDLYATNVRASNQDDPALHGGRTRQTPHVEGHWPTHVYLEWNPLPKELNILSSLISAIQERAPENATPIEIHSLLRTDLDVQAPLHISLSRSLSLLTEQRTRFAEALKTHTNRVDVQSFDVNVSGLGWAPNFERNRWFLILQLERPPQNELNKLLAASNSAAVECGQPPLYETIPDAGERWKTSTRHDQGHKNKATVTDCTDFFHISIAWTLRDLSVGKLDSGFLATLKPWDLTVHFDSVKLKVGNVVESVPLAKPLPAAGIAGL